MKQKSLFKNAMYNFLYTGLNLLFPLITAPYVSRTLGATNLGKVNFASVIVNWFVIFAVFGTTTYGVREVAKVRDDREKLGRVFSEIFLINGFLSMIIAGVYFVAIFTIPKFYTEIVLYLIMSASIILNMFAIDWFYQGIEEYRYITIRSTIFKCISLVCIFVFVKNPNSYRIYGLISVLATSLSGILNYAYSRKFVKLRFKGIHPLAHIKDLKVFFLYAIIINVYTSFDQTLLGIKVDDKSVAYLSRCKMIVNMAISVSTAISNVTLPRASYYKMNDESKFRRLMLEVPNYILWITTPLTVGCILLSKNLMFALGGNEFLVATNLMMIISPVIILSPISGYLNSQVLVASGEERLSLKCAMLTGITSLILNLAFIPRYGMFAAGVVQLVAESIAVMMRLYFAKTKLGYSEIKLLNLTSIKYFLAAVLMGVVVAIVNANINSYIFSLLVCGVTGAFVYYILLISMREKVTLAVVRGIAKKF